MILKTRVKTYTDVLHKLRTAVKRVWMSVIRRGYIDIYSFIRHFNQKRGTQQEKQ